MSIKSRIMNALVFIGLIQLLILPIFAIMTIFKPVPLNSFIEVELIASWITGFFGFIIGD